jgi:hypothetical protein
MLEQPAHIVQARPVKHAQSSRVADQETSIVEIQNLAAWYP